MYQRYKDKEKRQVWLENWRIKNKDKIKRYAKEWHRKNPKYTLERYYKEQFKAVARRKASIALKKGIIKKKTCAICNIDKAEMHHPNYRKPLEVIWLCKKHHMAITHRK